MCVFRWVCWQFLCRKDIITWYYSYVGMIDDRMILEVLVHFQSNAVIWNCDWLRPKNSHTNILRNIFEFNSISAICKLYEKKFHWVCFRSMLKFQECNAFECDIQSNFDMCFCLFVWYFWLDDYFVFYHIEISVIINSTYVSLQTNEWHKQKPRPKTKIFLWRNQNNE